VLSKLLLVSSSNNIDEDEKNTVRTNIAKTIRHRVVVKQVIVIDTARQRYLKKILKCILILSFLLPSIHVINNEESCPVKLFLEYMVVVTARLNIE
jgi:hypothetical protein